MTKEKQIQTAVLYITCSSVHYKIYIMDVATLQKQSWQNLLWEVKQFIEQFTHTDAI